MIELDGICKNFKVFERPSGKFALLRGAFSREVRKVNALEKLSFKIDEGELVGYIGPNGAGKSTTVKIMSGILVPDAGSCVINNLVPWKERVKYVAEIGVVFGQRSQLSWDVPVSDSFDFLKDVYEISENNYKHRLTELTETLDIAELLKTPARQLSLGQRMRCEIAAALLHRPKILFLDEPTIGLDAVSKLSLRDFLKSENKKYGTTMILTTHDMDDVEALCDRIMVIGKGKLLFDGNMVFLKREFLPFRSIKVKLENCKYLKIDDAEIFENDENCFEIKFDPEKKAAHEIISELISKYKILDLAMCEPDIDEVVAQMYKSLKI